MPKKRVNQLKIRHITFVFSGLCLGLILGLLIFAKLSVHAQDQLTVTLNKSVTIIEQPASQDIEAQVNIDSPNISVSAYLSSSGSTGNTGSLIPQKIRPLTYKLTINSSNYQPGTYTLRIVAYLMGSGGTTSPSSATDEYQITINAHQAPCSATTCTNWGNCQADGYRACQNIYRTPPNCVGGAPDPAPELCPATQAPNCSFVFSNWSVCQASGTTTDHGYQSRTVTSRTPSGCMGEPSTAELNRLCSVTIQTNQTNCLESDWTCSVWNVCDSSSNQSRTCTLTNTSCLNPSSVRPLMTRQCATTATITCTDYVCNGWSGCAGTNTMETCVNLVKTPSGCVGTPPSSVYARTCPVATTVPKCSEIKYDLCGPCQNGQQSCKATLKTPTGCLGDDYTTKSCNTTPPAPECKIEWSCDETWSECQPNGWQYKKCKQITCLDIASPTQDKRQTCVYVSPNPTKPTVDCHEDKWLETQTWSDCLNGRKQKIFKKYFDCPTVITPMPVISETCPIINPRAINQNNQPTTEQNHQPTTTEPTTEANQTTETKTEAKQATEATTVTTPETNDQTTVTKQEPALIFNQAQIKKTLPTECQTAKITDNAGCELYLRQQHSTDFCLQEGSLNKSACRQLLEKQYQKPSQCANLSAIECSRLINQVILSDYIEPNKLATAQEQMSSLINHNLIIDPQASDNNKISAQTVPLTVNDQPAISQTIPQPEIVKDVLPISSQQKTNLMVLDSVVDQASQQKRVSAVVLVDTDGDGLPDDQEQRFGTDSLKSDTDGDGYSDLLEIKTGYDPLGPGKLLTKIEQVDKAIINQVPLEQPKENSSIIDQTLTIAKIDNAGAKAGSYRLSGQAKPNQVVTLFIYSQMPLVLTTKTDNNGNWVYQLDKSLNDGKHEVYVAINDDSGRITSQAAPLSFFVKEAKAVTMDQYVAEDVPVTTPDPTNQMMKFYILGGSALILFAFILFVVFRQFFYQHHD